MSKDFFEEAEEELDMEFFFDRESIAYKHTRGSSGAQLQCRHCPDCGDNRWRTYFGVDSGRGNCFVCSRGYSKLSFVKAHFGFDNWRQTIEMVKEILKEQGWRPKRKAVVAIDYGEVVLPISEALPTEAGENLDYLENRGFDSDISAYFRWRWCEAGWWKYTDDDGKPQMQNFSNRVIIPVFDLDGSLKTFQGRDVLGFSDRKYLFPIGLPGTGRYLYNAQNVIATDHVAMGEGALDAAAIKVGLDEDPDLRHIVPIGSFGKHLSFGSLTGDDQLGRFIKLKERGVKIVTIIWDGEYDALIAALDAARRLAGIGLVVRIALLPHEKDPNEVTGDVLRKAYYEAFTWTPQMDLKMRMRNPYPRKAA